MFKDKDLFCSDCTLNSKKICIKENTIRLIIYLKNSICWFLTSVREAEKDKTHNE